jgi:hypothetical protein
MSWELKKYLLLILKNSTKWNHFSLENLLQRSSTKRPLHARLPLLLSEACCLPRLGVLHPRLPHGPQLFFRLSMISSIDIVEMPSNDSIDTATGVSLLGTKRMYLAATFYGSSGSPSRAPSSQSAVQNRRGTRCRGTHYRERRCSRTVSGCSAPMSVHGQSRAMTTQVDHMHPW